MCSMYEVCRVPVIGTVGRVLWIRLFSLLASFTYMIQSMHNRASAFLVLWRLVHLREDLRIAGRSQRFQHIGASATTLQTIGLISSLSACVHAEGRTDEKSGRKSL